jgi:hypothetical protein
MTDNMSPSATPSGPNQPFLPDPFSLPPIPEEELDQLERAWFEYAADTMLASEAQWTAQGLQFYWLDSLPGYVSSVDFDMFIPEPKAPARRIFRFSLIGGGQVCTVENWRWAKYADMAPFLSDCPGPTLRVTAHADDVVHRYHGKIDYGAGPGEMSAKAVLFPRSTPSDVVERVGRTLRAIDTTSENFYALLDGSSHCAICARALRDEVSKLVGVGPDCAKALNIPHSIAAATRRLQLRQQLLGLAADSDQQG